MNLLELRNRIRDKAIDNGLTYTEIETLFDVNLLLEQTMPCLMWRYSGETNNFDEVGTEMSLNVYLITTFPDSVRVETDTYQRDYIVTQQNALRTYFYNWLQAMPFESGDDYLEIISTEEIPIAERLGINEFLTVDFRVNISIKRDFCVDPEQIAPTPSQVQVYFNDVLRYTQACNVDLELILKNQDGDLINDATFTGYEIVVTQGGGQVTININGILWDVIDGGETENIIVRQSSGSTQVGAKQGQYYRIADSVITLEDALGTTLSTTNVKAEDPATIVAPSARVSNSDDSYDVNVTSGGDLELPDSQINVNGSSEGNVVSVKTIDVNITDGTNPVVPDAVSLSGNTLDIEVPSASTPVGATLMKTGQTISYRTGDDGDLEEGRDVDFFTLASNNPFGNTNRFTDELGGTTYTNNIVIDWSTYDTVAGTVLGYYRVMLTGSLTWENHMDYYPLLSVGLYTSGWRLPNIRELMNLFNFSISTSSYLNYTPILIINLVWSSTTNPFNTANALYASTGTNAISSGSRTSTIAAVRSIGVRTFTVTGTTLT